MMRLDTETEKRKGKNMVKSNFPNVNKTRTKHVLCKQNTSKKQIKTTEETSDKTIKTHGTINLHLPIVHSCSAEKCLNQFLERFPRLLRKSTDRRQQQQQPERSPRQQSRARIEPRQIRYEIHVSRERWKKEQKRRNSPPP